MDASMIGTIALVVIGAWLAFSLLLGFIRGFKKSFVRLIWLAITAVVVFFATPPLASFLNSFDISSFGLNINGPVNHLSDIGVNLVNSMNMSDAIEGSPALQAFVANLPTMIINVVLFVVLFWVLKILFYPLFLIIYSRVFDKKRRQERIYKKRVQELKKKGVPITDDDAPTENVRVSKLRLLGGIIGVVCGLLVMAVTLSPVIGVTSIYETVNANVTIEQDGNTVPYLSTVVDNETQGYISEYENSIAKKILMYSGIETVGGLAFSNLAVVKVGDKTIKLVDEVQSASVIYNKALKIYALTKDRSDITYADLDEVLSLAESILENMDKSQALYSLGGELSSFAIDNYLVTGVNEGRFQLEFAGEDFSDLMSTVVNDLSSKHYGIRDYQNQVVAMLDIASLMNDIRQTKDGSTTSLLAEVVSGRMTDVRDMLSFVTDNVTSIPQFSNELVGDILDVDILNSVLPDVVNSAIGAGFNALGVSGFEKKADLSILNIQNSLEGLVENGLKFYDVFKDGNGLAFGNSSQCFIALGSAGKIVDILKANLLSQNSYLPDNSTDGLLNFFINKANEYTVSFLDLSNIIDSIKDITSFQQELESLSGLYSVVTQLLSDEENPLTLDTLLDEEYTAINGVAQPLATVIDASKSKIITNENIREFLDKLITKFAPENEEISAMLNMNTASGKSVKNIALDNIYNNETHQTNIKNAQGKSNWDNEVVYTLALIRKIVAIDDFTMATAEEMTALGECVDNVLANTKLVITSETLRALMDKVLTDGMSSNTKLNEIMSITISEDVPPDTVKSKILDNIYSPATGATQVTSYKDEMARLQSVIAGDFAPEMTLSQMGNKLDGVALSQILTRSIVKKVVAYYINDTLASQSEEIRGKISDGVAIVLSNVQNEVPVDGVYPIKYEMEFGYIDDLITAIKTTGTDKEKYTAIGTCFDNISGVGSITTPSKIITRQVINSIMGKYIDSYVDSATSLDAGLKDIIKGMKNSLEEIESYASEMGYLVDVIALQNKTSLSDIGQVIDSVADSKVLPIVSVVGYYIDKELAKLDTALANAVRPIKDNLPVTSYQTEFGYVNDLMSKLNVSGGASINFVQLGEVLDNILATEESELITQSNVDALVTYFFSNNSDITSHISDFPIAFDMIKSKVVEETPYNANKYATLFGEFKVITSSLATFDNAMSYDYNSFKADSDIGSTLDTYANMSYACDKYIAKQIAKVIVDKILDICQQVETDYGRTDIVSAVNDVLENSQYDFEHYAEKDVEWNEDVVETGYFAGLISAIQSAMPALS